MRLKENKMEDLKIIRYRHDVFVPNLSFSQSVMQKKEEEHRIESSRKDGKLFQQKDIQTRKRN